MGKNSIRTCRATKKSPIKFTDLSIGGSKRTQQAKAARVKPLSKEAAQRRLTGHVTKVVDRELYPYVEGKYPLENSGGIRIVSGGLPGLGKRRR